ncbi:MAG: hypothetical protein MRY32_09320 [Rickettsiales bacterium]|nr:hypothetical protein [Rickettsiales bacterium]
MKVADQRISNQYHTVTYRIDARMPLLLLGLTAWLTMNIFALQGAFGG